MILLDRARPSRRAALTPMIDVVFLLLIFFILVARFGAEDVLPLDLAPGGSTDASGPPRLIDLGGDTLRLNGTAIALVDLPAALSRLTKDPGDLVILRPGPGADLQRVTDVLTHLRGAGFTAVTLVEGAQ